VLAPETAVNCIGIVSGKSLPASAPKTQDRQLASAAMFARLLFLSAILASRSAAAPAGSSSKFAAAIALYDAGNYSSAQKLFEQIVVNRPDDPEVNFRLGRLALWFDDEAGGRACLEKAVRAAPNDARIQDALGDAYGLTAQKAMIFAKYGWARKCQAAYARAVELEPQNPDYHWSLLRYFMQAPRIVGGGMNKAYAEAGEIRKLDAESGRIAFATLFLAEKKYDQAFHEFDEVLRGAPDDFMTLYQVGRFAALSGRQLDRGLAALRRCLQLPLPAHAGAPKYGNVHFRLGNILEKEGDLEGAKAEYAAARKADPDLRPDKDALKN
jgi:tetratricopeptide (TPR) repeat protein